MNAGQEKFLEFILQRVKESEQDYAKELLAESFSKQDDGSFDHAYMKSFIPKMLEMIQPEYVEEVKGIMNQHRA